MDVSGLPFSQEVLERTPPEVVAFVIELLAKTQAQLAKAEARIRELEHRLNLNSSNSSKPPSSDGPQVKPAPLKRKSGRQRGGQLGRRGFFRSLAPVDKVERVVDHRPVVCDCGAALAGDDPQPMRVQCVELPPIEPKIVEHRMHRLTCPRCGRRTRSAQPADLASGQFGPRLQAVVNLLCGGYRIGKRPLKQLLADVFGLDLSTGVICKINRRMAAALEPTAAELAEYVRNQNVNVDETGWREGGKRAWLWTAVGPAATSFVIAARRTAKVARQLLGADFAQTATCDRYKSYLWIKKAQLCWAHLRRDFQAMVDRGRDAAPIGEELLALADAIFDWWYKVRDGTIDRSAFRRHLAYLRPMVREQLENGAACGCAKTAGVCNNVLERERQLWTFARTHGVEPTNNAAERSLRHAVLWRKSSFGTDSAAGSRFVERILSVIATCRQQRRNVLDTLAQAAVALRQHQPAPSLLPAPTP